MVEYLLMQETPGGKKTILAVYTAKNRSIAQETTDKFNSIKDGCRYYLDQRTIPLHRITICLLCGQELTQEYQEKLLQARQAIQEIISKKYKDPEADTVANNIMLAIEQA